MLITTRTALFLLFAFIFNVHCWAQNTTKIDIIKINSGHSVNDSRHLYNWTVLEHALDISIDKFGPYKIKVTGRAIPNHQRLKALLSARFLNVAMSLTNNEWEEKAIPIRIPIRRGIFSYRLVLINKTLEQDFATINSVTQLKKFRVGLRKSWTTREVLSHLNFNIVDAYSYEAVFGMLDKNRSDFIPRGVNEIYGELALRKETLPNIMIEPNIALYIPSPYYMFVSHKEPRLAERLQYGLEKLVANGTLTQLFNQYYGEHIKRAELYNKRIIYIGNPLLPEKTPLDNKAYWHEFNIGH